MSLPIARRRVQWIELSADYRCNNRCLGCFSAQAEGSAGPEMTSREIVQELDLGRKQGARWLWLGGGEPTLRPDLVGVVRAAKKLGYERIKLQTNGMRLAYPDYVRALADAGATEVNFSIKGATSATHDRLAQTPGSHELMVKGIAEARAKGLRVEADLLIYRSNVAELPEMVRTYAAQGIERFHLWLFLPMNDADPALAGEVARMSEVVPRLVEAMDLGLSPRPDFITSLHTPACTVPASHHASLFHAASLDLLVVNPGGYRFFLEESPIEGGRYLERCGACSMRGRCGGLREGYLRTFGDAEFQPLGA